MMERWAIPDPEESRIVGLPPHPGRVLVVPGEAFDRLGRFQGFSREADRYLRALLVPELAEFRQLIGRMQADRRRLEEGTGKGPPARADGIDEGCA